MTKFIYASALTPFAPTISIMPGGTLTTKISGALYLQKRTRQGYTQFSDRVALTLTTGQSASVTIALNQRKESEDIQEFVLSFSPDGNYLNAGQIAIYDGYTNTHEKSSLPFSFILSCDEHFEIGKICRDETELPKGNKRIHGMKRQLESLGAIVEYDAENNTWTRSRVQSFSTYVTSSEGVGGCNRDLSLIDDYSIITPVKYGGGGISEDISFWLINDTGSTISKGTLIYLIVTSPNYKSAPLVSEAEDSKMLSSLLDSINGLMIRLRGYVNTLNGELDTTGVGNTGEMSGLEEAVYYKFEPGALSLPKDLPTNYAYFFTINADFRLESLRLPSNAAISFSANFYPFSSTFSLLAKLLGNAIAASESRRRIVPDHGLSAIAASGSGIINGFSFFGLPARPVIGLSPNKGAQLCSINSNGSCLIVDSIPETSDLRAIVSTNDGIGVVKKHPSLITLNAEKKLIITVVYPDKIRVNYPDIIASMNDGKFNASFFRLILKKDGTFTFWDLPININEATEVFTIGDISGIPLLALPTLSSPDFGLYEVTGISLSTQDGISIFDEGDYEIYYGLVYTNTVTAISHAPERGCILELEFNSIAKMLRIGRAWGDAIKFTDIPKLLPTEIAPYQTRTIWETGEQIFYNPDAFTGIKPTWKLDNEKGRWNYKQISTWYESPGQPEQSLGINGDWALDQNGDTWHKQNNLWVKNVSLRSTAASFIPMGVWNPSVNYSPPHLVSWNGGSWLCSQPSINHAPQSDAFWQNISSRGDRGDAGLPGGIIGSISQSSVTTNSLGQNNIQDITISVGISAKIRSITSTGWAWIRIYSTSAARLADANRSIEEPFHGSGLILDCETVSALSPVLDNVWFENFDNPPSPTAYLAIANLALNPQAITVTLDFVRFV
ncbi:MAG: hypothetical protein ACRCT1_15485 [Microcoleaceae cyanobacterium]